MELEGLVHAAPNENPESGLEPQLVPMVRLSFEVERRPRYQGIIRGPVTEQREYSYRARQKERMD